MRQKKISFTDLKETLAKRAIIELKKIAFMVKMKKILLVNLLEKPIKLKRIAFKENLWGIAASCKWPDCNGNIGYQFKY
jgi:hypothetical protein